jgi:hypothetical protein
MRDFFGRVLMCLVALSAGICFGIGIEQHFKGCP